MIPDINLLPHIEKNKTNPKLLMSLLGFLTVLILVVLVWQYFDGRSNLVRLQNEEQALIEQQNQLQTEYDILTTMNKGTLEESVAFVERVSYPVSPLIDEIQSLLQEHTYLRNYSFNDISVQMTIDFETLSAVSNYVNRLENSPYFTDVQVGTISNFNVSPVELISEDEVSFNEVPRYAVTMSLVIDTIYMALGGVQ